MYWPRRLSFAPPVAAVLLATAMPAAAQDLCGSSSGPDIIIFDIPSITRWGTVGDITGYSIGSKACNIGTVGLGWDGYSPDHPVIAQNLYRLKNGRFEHIGMSWAKHGYYAGTFSDCCTCQDPNDHTVLGVGCSDVYGATFNGNQAGINGAGGLGPRSEINAATGVFPFPYGSLGQTGDAIYKRLQVHNNDIDPDQNSGASYFAEIQYVTPDEAAAGTDNNNVSWAPAAVGAPAGGGWELSIAGDVHAQKPAIYAWKDADPNVTLININIPGDGRMILGYLATDNGDGTWHYEYALFNMTSHRSAQSFTIPIPSGVTVTNIGYHDVAYHSGEPYSGANWTSDVSGGNLTWQTQTFDENENANALRWGTLYNFRFNADAGPGAASAQLGLFRPGSPGSMSVSAAGPGGDGGGPPPPPPPTGNDGCGGAVDIALGSTAFSTSDATSGGGSVPCAGAINNDIWFTFHSTFTGKLRVSTCNSADFNTVIAVYSGCDCSHLTAIGCSDNASGCGNGSKVVVNVQANHCYTVRVGGASGQSGDGILKLSCADKDNAARAKVIYTGSSAGDRFGFALANGRSSNGDHSACVGAFRNDANGADAGRMYAYEGLDSNAQFTLDGAAAGDGFGYSIASAGDMNGDGQDDVIVGAPFNDQGGINKGKVYVFSGASHTLLWAKSGESPGDEFGYSVASAGDVNGDGKDDVLVGAPFHGSNGSDSGRAYLLNGANGAMIKVFSGQSAGDRFGASVAGLGDIDDDGKDDIAIGAPRSDQGGVDAGQVWIYSGANHQLLQVINGSSPGDRLGTAIAGRRYSAGGEDHTLLVVGAPYSDVAGSNSGRVLVYKRHHSHPDNCSHPLCLDYSIHGSHSGDKFGAAVAVNSDAGSTNPAMMIGAPGSDLNGSGSGALFVYKSSNGALITKHYGEAAGDAFGASVAMAGDLNGDGKADCVVGAPDNDAGGSRAGRAYVFLSQGSPPQSVVALGGSPAEIDGLDDADQSGPIDGAAEEDQSNEPVAGASIGDVNLDGAVDANDLQSLLNAWGPCAVSGSAAPCSSDLNHDGVTNVDDLLLLMDALKGSRP